MSQLNEKREYLRAEISVFVNEDVKTGVQLTKAVDISEGGVRYIKPSADFCRESNEVYLEFSLPDDDHTVKALGKVVGDDLNLHTHATSVVFTALSTDNADRIRRYVIRRKRAELFESLRKDHLDTALSA